MAAADPVSAVAAPAPAPAPVPPATPPPPPPPAPSLLAKLSGSAAPPPLPPWRDAAASGALTLAGMGLLLGLHYSCAPLRGSGLVLNLGSFGATAVLVYAAPASPLAQPRNVVLGHALSAAVGVGARLALAGAPLPGARPAGAALAVALSVWLMAAAGVAHPPGGATALIAAVGGAEVEALGWAFVGDAALGGALLVLVALLGNNALPWRRYPVWW